MSININSIRGKKLELLAFLDFHQPHTVILYLFLEGFPIQLPKDDSHAPILIVLIPSYKPSCTVLHLKRH